MVEYLHTTTLSQKAKALLLRGSVKVVDDNTKQSGTSQATKVAGNAAFADERCTSQATKVASSAALLIRGAPAKPQR